MVVSDQRGRLGSSVRLADHGCNLQRWRVEVHQLSRPVPVDVSDAGAQQELVHVHGTMQVANPSNGP